MLKHPFNSSIELLTYEDVDWRGDNWRDGLKIAGVVSSFAVFSVRARS